MKQRVEGYFTVEATIVLPMVLMTVVLIIYLFIFQYDRCLLEQDMGILALRGATLQAEDNESRMRQLREQADKLDRKKYIAWNGGEIELKLEKGMVYVHQNGQTKCPFKGMDYGNRILKTTADYKNHLISPVSFVRSCRKVIGG